MRSIVTVSYPNGDVEEYPVNDAPEQASDMIEALHDACGTEWSAIVAWPLPAMLQRQAE